MKDMEYKSLFFVFLILLVMSATETRAETEDLVIGNFANRELSKWEPLVFNRETKYSIIPYGSEFLIEAKSINSASGLVRTIRIDLHEYPYLNWSWQVVKSLATFDEREKSGDDFVARIYVIIKDGMFPWNKKAVNYVWAGSLKKKFIWPSPYVGKKSMMMVVRSHQDVNLGLVVEKRNLFEDLQLLFGQEIQYIDAVALMTDSDDSEGEAIARYGNIYFSKE